METLPSRLVAFDACPNFRDLGGYAGLDGRPVRWRRLFRSMTPEYMTPDDVASARALHVGLVLDLRGQRAISSGPLGEAPSTRLALGPALTQPLPAEIERFLALPPHEGLPRVLDMYAPYFARGLEAIVASDDVAAVYHCRLGKDRTGVFSALLLKLLGVGDEDVIEDYLLTEQYEPAVRSLLEAHGDRPEREPRVAKEPVSRRAMEGVLQRLISQFGGAYGFFGSHGVSSATLDAFVEGMLTPRQASSPLAPGATDFPRSIPVTGFVSGCAAR